MKKRKGVLPLDVTKHRCFSSLRAVISFSYH